MKTWRTCVLSGLAAILPVAGMAADPAWKIHQDLARELIATMKLDEQAAQKIENQILAWCQVEKCDADLRQCLMKFDREEVTLFLEPDVAEALTPDELRQAIAYFRTETGLKHLDILRAERGLGGNATLFNQTPEDRARMLAFLDTRAGYLIITRSVLYTESDRATVGRARRAFWRCRPES